MLFCLSLLLSFFLSSSLVTCQTMNKKNLWHSGDSINWSIQPGRWRRSWSKLTSLRGPEQMVLKALSDLISKAKVHLAAIIVFKVIVAISTLPCPPCLLCDVKNKKCGASSWVFHYICSPGVKTSRCLEYEQTHYCVRRKCCTWDSTMLNVT